MRYPLLTPDNIAGATARASWLTRVLFLTMAVVACGPWLGDEARIERAREAFDDQQYAAAIIDTKSVLMHAPDNVAARVLLGDFEAAESHLLKALEQGQPIDPIRVVLLQTWLMTGQPERALAIADPAAATDTGEAFFIWLYRGDALADTGSTADALRAYQQAERLSVDTATARLRAAELYWGEGNLADARTFAESALSDDPENFSAHLTLGAILLDAGNWQEAQAALTRANADLPLDDESRGYVLAYLAQVHIEQGNLAAAREAVDRVAELWPEDDPDLRLLQGRVALAEGDTGTASMVLSTVRRDGLEARGDTWPEEDQAAFEAGIREQYETQGHPYYASARLWDDGVIDPVDTRRVLSLGLSAAMNRPSDGESPYGIFRM